MKICFITNTIFNLGGVQRVVSVLASKLSESYEVDVLCTDKNFKINRKLYNLDSKVNIKINSELLNKKITSKIIEKVFRKLNYLSGIFNNAKMKDILAHIYYPNKIRCNFIKYLNSQDYDFIIGVEGYYSILVGIIADKLTAKTIGWQHNSYDAYLNNKGIYYWNQDELFRKYVAKLNQYIVLTNDDKVKYQQKLGIDCRVIYNPLSFESDIKSLCCEKKIIFVGRLVEQQKGLDLLIEAFKIVYKVKNDWILNIIGDGVDREKLINNIKKYNLQNNVILIGQSDNVKEHYLKSSIFVSTSRWEGFGLVITEAMECGLPIVSFDNSGPKEIINKPNINGILVKNHNVAQLANEIIKLIEDDKKRKSISIESIKRAKNFNVNYIIKQWIEIIEKL